MAIISLAQQKNNSTTVTEVVTDECWHYSLEHYPIRSALKRYLGANTNTIPPTEREKRQDLALSASTTITAQSSCSNGCITKTSLELMSFLISLVSHIEYVECTKYNSPTGTKKIADRISQMSNGFPNALSKVRPAILLIPTDILSMPNIKFNFLYFGLLETLTYLFLGISVAIAVIFIKSPFHNCMNKSLKYNNTFNCSNIELERAPGEVAVSA
ncbi:hypothetical protein ACFLXH_06300, partial [Chloroflexota bacterium]